MELRRETRIPVTLGASFIPLSAKESTEVTIYNLSPTGCAIKSEFDVEPSRYVSLFIQAPGQSKRIKVELAAVRWIQRGTFGLEFILVQAENKKHLQQLIQILRRPY
jgi:c-di-GMP-binding flagellar brake protein YcgR